MTVKNFRLVVQRRFSQRTNCHAIERGASTITSKINGTPKGCYSTILKLYFILPIPNLLAHNNITMIYYLKVNKLRKKASVASKGAIVDIFGGIIYFAVDNT